jgi:hypothetical protein
MERGGQGDMVVDRTTAVLDRPYICDEEDLGKMLVTWVLLGGSLAGIQTLVPDRFQKFPPTIPLALMLAIDTAPSNACISSTFYPSLHLDEQIDVGVIDNLGVCNVRPS